MVMTKVGGLESRRLAWQLDGAYLTGFDERLQIPIDRCHAEPCDRLLRSFQDLRRQQRISGLLDQSADRGFLTGASFTHGRTDVLLDRWRTRAQLGFSRLRGLLALS